MRGSGLRYKLTPLSLAVLTDAVLVHLYKVFANYAILQLLADSTEE